MRVILRIVVICALLFQQCASEVSESSMSSQSYAINGTFIYLNTSTISHSDLAKCPQSISIDATALKYESPTSFSLNLAGLNITTVNCTYGIEETNFVELSNYTVSSGRREPMKSYTIWNMTLPDNSLKCVSQASVESFPGGKFSFLPVPALQESLDMPDDYEKNQNGKDGMKGKVDYLLLLDNESMDEMCAFFPATQYGEMKKFIEQRYQEHKENDDMRIGNGKSLKFCTICECGEKLGTDLDLNSIEMKEDASSEMPSPKEDDEDEQEHWRPPEVLIKNQRCPVAYSNRSEEVVNEEDEYMEETGDDKRETSMPSEGSKDTFKEAKRLVLYAVVNKLYDEISSELGEEFDDSSFDMRRTFVSLMTSFHRRRVMFMKKGAKCGSRHRPIDKDTVFLYEKNHILRQLHHKQFIRKNMGRVDEILRTEEEGVEAFTLHVLQKNTDGRFSACALSNSEQACALLNQNSFCESFKPLGSMSNASSNGPDKGSEGEPPQKGQGLGGPPLGLGNSGSGPPSTGGPPSNGGTTTTGQPSDNPDPGAGKEGSPNQPGSPGQDNSQLPGPSSEAKNKPGGNQEAPSPSASPTPINASPTPTAQPSSGSSNGLCFPALSKVELEDGRMVHMDELEVGDSIRDGFGSFSKVILFTHAAKDIVSEFVRLETDFADIVLSAQHYLPVNGRLLTAESAKVGDTIVVLSNSNKMRAIITKVEQVWMPGLFNPQTTSGSIAVWMNGDAVIASAYTSAVEPNVGHSLLAPLRMLNYMTGWVVPWSWVFENGADKLMKTMTNSNSHSSPYLA